MQKIIPNLWFDTNAEEAVAFYTSIFKGGKTHAVTHYGEAGHEVHGMDAGSVLTIDFEIEGFKIIALNGGPHFKFTPALSFMVNFDPSRDPDARERIDDVWERLADGGEALMPIGEYPFSKRYGWIQDKFGVSWQLILTNPEGEERPVIIPSMLFVGEVAGKAEEAINFYTSIFKDTKVGTIVRREAGDEYEKAGSLLFGDCMLEGQWFSLMDSAHPAHSFGFNEALSLMVLCKNQAEIDYYWDKLSAVREAEQCGWLKDQFGVSWQVAPEGMEKLLNDPDRAKADRVMSAMMQMKKIDIAALEAAANG